MLMIIFNCLKLKILHHLILFLGSVIRLDSLPNPNTYSIETATINNAGTGYQSGDIVSISNGATFTVGDESGSPTTEYSNNSGFSSTFVLTSVAWLFVPIGPGTSSYILISDDNGVFLEC